MKLKKIILIAIASFTALVLSAKTSSSAFWSQEQLVLQGFVRQSKNKNLELYYNKTTAIIAVKVLNSGYVWYSTPLDWEDDEMASGFTKNILPSLLSIRCKDKNSTFRPANSYVNVVKRKGLKLSKITNGIRLTHRFVREGITIPLDITIDGNSVLMSVPLSEITEDEESENLLKLLDFEIDPYFGAATKNEEGFILVPDGSGAIIKFNNNRSDTPYLQYIYGRDNSIVPVKKKSISQDVALPVFGLSREDAGFISVVEASASRGMINAETAGQKTGYNTVFASCIVRDFDVFSFRERTGTPRDIKIFEKTNLESLNETFSVRYILLDKEENNITGMASAYRKYLQKNDKFPKSRNDNEPALVLNFIGSSLKKRPVIGIPTNIDIPYTTFEDAKNIIENLQNKGINNFVIKFDGWVKGGVLGKYPSKPSASSGLGGNKDLKKFITWLDEQQIPFYAGVDFVNLFETDSGHIKELCVNHAINRTPVKIPDYRMSTFTDEKYSDAYPYYILRAPNIAQYYTKFMTLLDKKYPSIGIAPDTLGNQVSSDFGIEGTTRPATVEIFNNLLANTSTSRNILLSRPFDYALTYSSYITDVPMQSSMFDIESETVPFYQLVIKGYIPFSNLPANRNGTLEDYKLGLIETGSDVSFTWIKNHPDYIRDSRMQSYMNLYSDDWIDDAQSLYEEVYKVTSKVRGKEITDYTIDGDVHTTVFSNGIKVTVNYANKTYSVTEEKKND